MLVPSSSNFLKEPSVVYDSTEQNLRGVHIPISTAEQVFMRDAADVTEKPFSALRSQMSEENFGAFLSNNGFALDKYVADSFFDRYKGSTELALYFDLLPFVLVSDDAVYKLLTVVAFGEKQPGRWMMVVEGVWKVREI